MMLTGRVTLNSLGVAPHAVVEVHNSQGDVLDQIQVDGSGIYAFHLIAGTWRLRAWDGQGRRAWAEVRVGDSDAIFDIELREPEGVSRD